MKNFNLQGYLRNNRLLNESIGEEPAQHDRALGLVDNAVLPILGDIRNYMNSKENLDLSKPSEAMRALLDISDYFEDTPELANTISDMYEDGFSPEDIAAFFYTDHSDALGENKEIEDDASQGSIEDIESHIQTSPYLKYKEELLDKIDEIKNSIDTIEKSEELEDDDDLESAEEELLLVIDEFEEELTDALNSSDTPEEEIDMYGGFMKGFKRYQVLPLLNFHDKSDLNLN